MTCRPTTMPCCSQGQSLQAAITVHRVSLHMQPVLFTVILHMQPCCSHGQSLQAAITVHTVSLYSQCCSQGQSLQAASDVHRVSLYRQPVLFTGSVSIGSQCCSQGQSLQAASAVHRVSLHRQPMLSYLWGGFFAPRKHSTHKLRVTLSCILGNQRCWLV